MSGPRRAYYNSETFKKKCDRPFQEVDTDGNGVLPTERQKPVIMRELDIPKISDMRAQFNLEAFDQNHNSTLSKQGLCT